MFSKESLACLSIGRVVAYAWVFFVTVYFFLTLTAPYLITQIQGGLIKNQASVLANSQLEPVFKNGQAAGFQAAIGQLGQALGTQLQGGCKEPVPVTFGSGVTVNVLTENCLQLFAEQAAKAQKK